MSRDLPLYEKLLALFPGYKGYKEKELIRETDKVVRERLYRMLKEAEYVLREAYSRAVSMSATGIDVNVMDSVIYRLDSIAEKILHAPHGYKPLFNIVKVDETKLNKLLEFDLSLGEAVSRFLEEVKNRSVKIASLEDARGLFQYVSSKITEIEDLVNKRENYLLLIG
ncbi:hypothetical protein ACSU1N_01285 [Thermogladius sp. 4427co]|uniref:hypothetical protein n=1 Tax=Thermogladius sp. 4427co TaxID=3450718 RepID=UPI003F78BA9B